MLVESFDSLQETANRDLTHVKNYITLISSASTMITTICCGLLVAERHRLPKRTPNRLPVNSFDGKSESRTNLRQLQHNAYGGTYEDHRTGDISVD
jgi:hypothetical protein